MGQGRELDLPESDLNASGELFVVPNGVEHRPVADVREIEGRQALFVVNIETKRMAGEVSEGMLFDIGYAD